MAAHLLIVGQDLATLKELSDSLCRCIASSTIDVCMSSHAAVKQWVATEYATVILDHMA